MNMEIMKKMIQYSNHNRHDINHFIKVYGYAKAIGELENLDFISLETLEIAAIIHDIACPLCRQKYGKALGYLQEKEGMILAKEFLKEFALPIKQEERIIWLVGHHHTYENVTHQDHQILLEADFIVNADEHNLSLEKIKEIKENIFKTDAGKALINDIWNL